MVSYLPLSYQGISRLPGNTEEPELIPIISCLLQSGERKHHTLFILPPILARRFLSLRLPGNKYHLHGHIVRSGPHRG